MTDLTEVDVSKTPPPWPGYYEGPGPKVRSRAVPVAISYVGFGGTRRELVANYQLGVGVYRIERGKYGIRRAAWEAAFGYVSGFRVRDIAYYVVTRSLSKKFCDWVVAREMKARGEL